MSNVESLMRDVARAVQGDARRRQLLPEIQARLEALDEQSRQSQRAHGTWRLSLLGAAVCTAGIAFFVMRPTPLSFAGRRRGRRTRGRRRRTSRRGGFGAAVAALLGRFAGDVAAARAGARRHARRERGDGRAGRRHRRRLRRSPRADALGDPRGALPHSRDRHEVLGRLGSPLRHADRDDARGFGRGDGSGTEGPGARRRRAAAARERGDRRSSGRGT